MPELRTKPASPAARPGHSLAWKTLRGAAAVAFVLGVINAIPAVQNSPVVERAATGAFMLGLVILSGLVLYGVWQLERWALWAGGIMAGMILGIIPFSFLLRVNGQSLSFSTFDIIVACLQCGAYAAFLVGLFLLRAERTHAER